MSTKVRARSAGARRSRAGERSQRERAKARRARARRRRSRALTWGIPAAALLVIALMAVVATLGTRGSGPSGAVAVQGPARQAPLAVGDSVPDFSAPALGGGHVVWSDFRGEPAVLAIWAPWCPHCEVEMKRLARVVPQHDVAVAAIATWIGMRPGPSPEQFVKETGAAFPTALDDADFTLAGAMGLQATPLLYFVDAEGVVTSVVQGESTEEELRALLAEMTSSAGRRET